jgi:hypothetical protein
MSFMASGFSRSPIETWSPQQLVAAPVNRSNDTVSKL